MKHPIILRVQPAYRGKMSMRRLQQPRRDRPRLRFERLLRCRGRRSGVLGSCPGPITGHRRVHRDHRPAGRRAECPNGSRMDRGHRDPPESGARVSLPLPRVTRRRRGHGAGTVLSWKYDAYHGPFRIPHSLASRTFGEDAGMEEDNLPSRRWVYAGVHGSVTK
jgi:hypothetical protein